MDYKTLINGETIPVMEEDSYGELLIKKGLEHELNILDKFNTTFGNVIRVTEDSSFEYRVDSTLKAIAEGVDVIYQAVLINGPWVGYADFLVKCEIPSDLGPFSYEVFDTKLARSPKPEHIIQLSTYSDLLFAAQGILPTKMHLILGNGTQADFTVSDFHFYYLHLKSRFETFVQDLPNASYPEPCRHCDICQWQPTCKARWEQDDHLSLIPNITRMQRDKLKKANIHTVAYLGESDSTNTIPNLNQNIRLRLQSQAKLQMHKTQTKEDTFELLPHVPGKGFERLPKPADGDLFFDIEGDPLYPDGLEYLFGIFYVQGEKETFTHWWAHDHDEEKKTFTELMGFLENHLQQHPSAHIYHYNHYETTALKRLGGRYGVCEEQIDNLLREHKFIDLYTVARESIITSESGFSLKNLEVFYMEKRDDVINTAGESVVTYNKWRELEDPQLLNNIRDYNLIDCQSTYLLRNWLIELKPVDSDWLEEKLESTNDESIERKPWEIEYEDYKALLNQVDGQDMALAERASHLLEFHRREAKVDWWETYARQDKFIDELIDDLECLADLSLTEPPVPVKRSWLYTYQFPPQEYRLRRNDTVMNVETLDSAGSIFDIDDKRCLVKLKIGNKQHNQEPLPSHFSVGPKNPIAYGVLRNAIYSFADSVIAQDGNDQCIRDLLNRSVPRMKNKKPGEMIVASDDLLYETTKAVMDLDNSCLTIQGPPGTGKTYISSHVIIELLRQGKKVGITSNSHKAIHVMLEKIEAVALEQGFDFVGVKKATGNLPETYYKGYKGPTGDQQFIFNLDKGGDVDDILNNALDEDDILNNALDEDDTYGGNVIALEDGQMLSFDDSTPMQRTRVWSSKLRQVEEQNEDAPEGVEKTSLKEPLLRFATLFAGTAWLFSRPGFRQELDYLFVDEAGQVALANVVAMATSAKNIVLVGDQMQLSQPMRGTHPGEAGTSGLEFLFGEHETIPPELGIFLDTTRRLHPNICAFVSSVFYEGRLKPHKITRNRSLIL
ncbi:TM0106 family RecB-like putative nuclease, partial [Dehalococcoidia bacterium]|nr:TM0106 family RecB-like putative nuclease [Dehalococcoidia bacterium]